MFWRKRRKVEVTGPSPYPPPYDGKSRGPTGPVGIYGPGPTGPIITRKIILTSGTPESELPDIFHKSLWDETGEKMIDGWQPKWVALIEASKGPQPHLHELLNKGPQCLGS